MHVFNRIQQEDQQIRFGFSPRAHKSRFWVSQLGTICPKQAQYEIIGPYWKCMECMFMKLVFYFENIYD